MKSQVLNSACGDYGWRLATVPQSNISSVCLLFSLCYLILFYYGQIPVHPVVLRYGSKIR